MKAIIILSMPKKQLSRQIEQMHLDGCFVNNIFRFVDFYVRIFHAVHSNLKVYLNLNLLFIAHASMLHVVINIMGF